MKKIFASFYVVLFFYLLLSYKGSLYILGAGLSVIAFAKDKNRHFSQEVVQMANAWDH